VDIRKKDQGRAHLDEGSIPLRLDEDDPATTDAMALVADEGGETYKTPSK
jgi:hypothetical protein